MTSDLADQWEPLYNSWSLIIPRSKRRHLSRVVFLTRLPPRPEKALMLRIHTHKPSCVEGRIMVVQLELPPFGISWLLCLPTDSMKNSSRRIMTESSVYFFLREPDKQIPDFWVFRMKCRDLRAHLIQPSCFRFKTGSHHRMVLQLSVQGRQGQQTLLHCHQIDGHILLGNTHPR